MSYFVARNGEFTLTETLDPTDRVLAQSDSYAFRRYVEDIKQICGDPSKCRFPDSYFGNVRPWDYTKVLEYGDFKPDQQVLEVGGLHTYFCAYLCQKVGHYTCTDSFYWAKRSYCQSDRYQTPAQWCDYLVSVGKGKLWAEEADIQHLKYSDDSFERLVCISTIEHVPDDRGGIMEMMRVLQPGGLLLLTTEFNPTWSKDYSEQDDSFYRVYDQAGIDKLLDGLNVEEMEVHHHVDPGNFTTLFARIRK